MEERQRIRETDRGRELMGDGKSLIGVIEGDAEQINEAQAASDAGQCIKAVLRIDG